MRLKRLTRVLLPGDVTSRLGGSAAASVLLKTSHALIGLAIGILLARMLGPDDYGRYSLAYAVVFLLALPAQAGLPILLVRGVAAALAQRDWSRLSGLLKRSDQFALSLMVLAIVGGAGLGVLHTPLDLGGVLRWALVLLPLVAFTSVRSAAIVGLGHVVQGQLPDLLVRPGTLLSILVLLQVLGFSEGLQPAFAMALHAFAALIALVFAMALFKRRLPPKTQGAEPEYQTRKWLASLAPLSLLAGLGVVNSYTDVVILGWLATPADVGVYRVAVQASIPVFFVLAAVNAVVAPEVARVHQLGDRRELQRLATWAARVGLVGALPAAVGLIVFGGAILSFVLGEVYAFGATALAILSAGQLVGVSAGAVGTFLNMTGHERDTVRASAVAAVLNIVLNLVLIPWFGIAGAAVATSVSLVVWNLLLVSRVRDQLGLASVAWRSSPRTS